MNSYWRLFKIHFRLGSRLARLWVAGRLVKLGFWISPDLKREMGYK